MGGGGTLGDGGPLSPLSILLLVVLLQLLDGFVDFLRKRGLRSNKEVQLQQEIKQLLKEAGKLSMPSTFAQAAKLRRMAAAKEKELSKKNDYSESSAEHEEYSKEKKWSMICLQEPCWFLREDLVVEIWRCCHWRNHGRNKTMAGFN